MKLACWIVFAFVLVSLPLALASDASDQEVAIQPSNRKLPKGTYTAIVFTATGVPDGTAATGVLRVGREQFLVNISPGATVAIPFGDGWVLEQDATITLRAGAGTLGAQPDVWAITPTGPLALERD